MDKKEKCLHCNGTGKVSETKTRIMFNGKFPISVPYTQQTTCRYCNGKGTK